MATVTVPTTSTLPVAGGDIIAAPLNGWITNLKTFVEGNNIDENNVDYSNSDGIVVMGQAQTITGLKTFENTSAAAGGVRTAAIFSIDPTSGTPTDGDGVEILFQADDDEGNVATIAELEAIMTDTDNGDEDSEVKIKALIAGAAAEFMVAGTPADGAGRVVFNDASADIDFRIETNNIANGFVVDAGLDVFAFGAAGADDKFVTISPPAAAHATTVDTYALHVTAGGAQTIPSGTTALVASVAIEEPNITATGTVTSAATLYIKNAPTEGGSNYALWVDDGAAKFDSTVTIADGSLTLGSTAVTSTAAEINLIDGGTARGTDAVATGDGLLVNDGGTMKMTNVDTVSTYFSSHSVGGSNIVTTGALNSGSITSGFGTIDTGSSTITTTGVITSGGFTIGSAVVDEAELEILDGATVTTAELNLLDALDRGSIIYGNASGVTAVLGQGGPDTVLTSDGTDISWAAATVGDITSVVAGSGMTGGATSGAATLNVIGGDGITANANDVAITPAQTTITSIYATDLIIGEDSETAIDFGTPDEIDFKINNTAELTLSATALYPIADAGLDLGTSALGYNDLHLGASGVINFDNANMTITHTTGALTVGGGTLTVGANTDGHDVKFFGNATGSYMEWDESEEQLRILGPATDAAASSGKLLLATAQVGVASGDILGQIDFQAPLETQGGDGVEIAASIRALAQDTFTATVNKTDLIFYTGSSEAATEKFRFTSDGELGVGGANYGTDGQVLTSTGAGTAPAWESASAGFSAAPFGDGSDGTVSNITDADFEAATIAQSGTISLTSNRTLLATSTITLSQAITVNKQDGDVRGSYPVKEGSPGIPLGAILAVLGSKAIPPPIRPGGGGTGLCGGVVQLIAGGNVVVGGTITATGTNASSDGGGGGGIVVIVSGGTISGSSAIDVSGGAGHATAAAKGGSGSYSGEVGGYAGVGGSGGGSGGWNVAPNGGGGGGGDGMFPGRNGGPGAVPNGGGGGSLDTTGSSDGSGGNGDGILSLPQTIRQMPDYNTGNITRPLPAAPSGGGGTNGGGGNASIAAQSTNPVGSGGGGGPSAANGAAGSAGSPYLFYAVTESPYAGVSGAQGGGGGGGAGRGPSGGSPGAGGAGAPTLPARVAALGAGAGGAGAAGSAGSPVGPTPGPGGGGGKGGNGGGAAGLVLMIAPTITYSGTVTGRHIKISGTGAEKFLLALAS